MPDLGALYLLPRVVGLQRAKELVFSTRDVSADEAREPGIVMEVHASEALEARARDMAERMARAAPTAVALSKAMLNARLIATDRAPSRWKPPARAAAFAAPEPAAQVEAILKTASGLQRPEVRARLTTSAEVRYEEGHGLLRCTSRAFASWQRGVGNDGRFQLDLRVRRQGFHKPFQIEPPSPTYMRPDIASSNRVSRPPARRAHHRVA